MKVRKNDETEDAKPPLVGSGVRGARSPRFGWGCGPGHAGATTGALL